MVRARYACVIWDWNGTLLDDVDWCMESMNCMLRTRGLRALDSRETYHALFGFPVIDYYRRVGFSFDREPYEALAREYIELYNGGDQSCALFEDAAHVLGEIGARGVTQVILSATEQGKLLAQVGRYGIAHYFDEILGHGDIYAHGKLDIGRQRLAKPGADLGRCVMIGDTGHDFEVARSLGIDCLLVARGHESRARLLSYGAPVLDNLRAAAALIL